ncbi:MAG TPA: hypothetical protein VK886_12145 [Vicinamibacterales bacterium]|nr:hypothetical protein [Vicinamibacterales bacterium]
METRRLWSVVWAVGLLMAGVASAAPDGHPGAAAEQATSSAKARQQPSRARGGQVVAAGRVIDVHGRRVFTMREAEGDGRELVVIAPRPLSPAMAGATVRVEGTLRRISAADVKNAAWSDVAERTRAGFVGRAALVASSLAAALEGEAPPAAPEPAPVEPPEPPIEPAFRAPLTVRASTLAAHVDGLAGQELRILNAHVVGVLEPNAFLIEPATRYWKEMGQRDRVLVLIERGALRVPAELIVGSNVTVIGMARTLVGVRVTAEVPWPARLSPETLERLEVRGAVLASSVQTPEGTELIGPAPAGR